MRPSEGRDWCRALTPRSPVENSGRFAGRARVARKKVLGAFPPEKLARVDGCRDA